MRAVVIQQPQAIQQHLTLAHQMDHLPATPTAAANTGGNEKDDYNTAVKLAMESKSKAQIDQAIGALQGFIKAYPKSVSI